MYINISNTVPIISDEKQSLPEIIKNNQSNKPQIPTLMSTSTIESINSSNNVLRIKPSLSISLVQNQ